jgi:hypothetical protein
MKKNEHRAIIRLLLSILSIFLLFGCEAIKGKVSEVSISQPDKDALRWWQTVSNDVTNNLVKSGLNIESIEQSHWWTSTYLTVGSMPLVNLVMTQPLVLPEVALYANKCCSQSGESLLELYGLAGEIADACKIDSSIFQLRKEAISLEDWLDKQYIMPEKYKESISKIKNSEKLPDNLRSALLTCFQACALVTELREKAFAGLSKDEILGVEKQLPSYYYPIRNGYHKFRGYTWGEINQMIETVELAGKVRFEYLLEAGRITSAAADLARRHLEKYLKANNKIPEEEIVFDEITPCGRIRICGSSRNIHKDDCAILIDLGGDDLYLNNAGGTRPNGMACAFCIDLNGNDVYCGTDYVQGAGFGGCGVLMDLKGDDRYVAENYSQGAALMGFSFFYEGAGNDSYVGKLGNQCFALFGYSVFSERGGDDSYRVDVFGQSFAGTLGVALMTEASGRDNYQGGGKYSFNFGYDASSVQGAGMGVRPSPWKDSLSVCGGVGILCDHQGEDNYRAYTQGQGCGYLFAIGILVDSEGNDTYYSKTYSQGTGCHAAAGVLIDRQGNDSYIGSGNLNMAQGRDKSVGILLDVDGDDRYNALELSIGSAGLLAGFAVFADASGDDVYIAKNATLGVVFDYTNEISDSYAYFFDYSGKDIYPREECKNNHIWTQGKYTNSVDTSKVVPTESNPKLWKPPIIVTQKLSNENQDRLNSEHTLVRFGAMYQTVKKQAVEDAINVGINGNEYSSGVLVDYISILLANKQVNAPILQELTKLRNSKDRNIRMIPVFCGWRLSEKTDFMTGVLSEILTKDHDLHVRSMAALSLGESKRIEAIPQLINALSNDPAWEVRRRAASALGNFENEKSAQALINAMYHDVRLEVRARSAFALGVSHMPGVDKELKKAMYSNDPFTRVYAATVLLSGYKDRMAIKGMIDFRRDYFNEPKWNQFYYNDLCKFSGHNFQTIKEWQEWWQKEGESFDIESIFKLDKALADTGKLVQDKKYLEAEQGFRKLAEQNPDNNLIKAKLSDVLVNQVVREYKNDLDRAIKRTKESIELNTNDGNLSLLAAFLYIKGDRNGAIEYMKKAWGKSHIRSKNEYLDDIERMQNGTYQPEFTVE